MKISNLIKKSARALSIFLLILNLSSPSIYAAVEANAPEVQTATQQAVDYQASNQQPDGSISGYGSETEWQIISNKAYEKATGETLSSTATMVESLKDDALNSSTPATDVERKILAIQAAGEDSSNFGGKDYKAELASRANNGQIGDQTLLNDDYFGVMAIDAMKAEDLKPIAQDSLNFIVANQKTDGGFSYTTDNCAWCTSDSNDTSAAIQAIYSALNLGLTHQNLESCRLNAISYLLSTQNDDGGFGYDVYSDSDGSSTAWALMALNSIGDSVKTNADSARAWLLVHQNPDGGFSYGLYGLTDSDTFTTAHASLALLGTSWVMNPTPTNFIAAIPLPVNPTIGQVQNLSLADVVNQITAQPAAINLTNLNLGSLTKTTAKADGVVLDEQDAASGPTSQLTDQTNKLDGISEKSNLKIQIFGILSLILLALGWFIITKKRNQEEEN
jgi:hypothetical protein